MKWKNWIGYLASFNLTWKPEKRRQVLGQSHLSGTVRYVEIIILEHPPSYMLQTCLCTYASINSLPRPINRTKFLIMKETTLLLSNYD